MGFSAIFDHWSALLAFGALRRQQTVKDPRDGTHSHRRHTISSSQPSFAPLAVHEESYPNKSRKRSAPIYVHDDEDEYQPLPKKVKFDLTHNKTVEFKKTAAPLSITPAILNIAEEKPEYITDDGFCMSGALRISSPSRSNAKKPVRSLNIRDDACVARSDLESGVAAMPFKILNSQDLFGLNLFVGPFPWRLLIDFNTTLLGVQRALDDTRETITSGAAAGMTYDEILIGALAKRGGMLEGKKRVEYVEDMIAAVDWEDWRWDEEYWKLVWSKRSFWEERSAAFREATAEQEVEEEAQ